MARADFAASVKSYARPARFIVDPRVRARARRYKGATRRVRARRYAALSRAWAVDFSKRIITESQLQRCLGRR